MISITIKRVGSRTVIHWYGSTDPDQTQIIKDPKHCQDGLEDIFKPEALAALERDVEPQVPLRAG